MLEGGTHAKMESKSKLTKASPTFLVHVQMPSGLTCHPVSLPSLQREGGKEGGWQGGREEGLAAGEEAVLGEVVRQELLRADLGLIPALKKRCPINAFPATQRVSLIEPGTPHY